MATAALIPISEYLTTSYSPDCDYIDGELEARNVGETFHSGLQLFFAAYFSNHRREWGLRAFPEQRVQVSATRFRIPDVSAVRLPRSVDTILREPPLLCIEILSPEDTLTRMQDRMDDYLAMGVGNLWLVDPVERRFWTVDADGIHPLRADAFTISDTAVRIPLAEIHAELDDLAAGM